MPHAFIIAGLGYGDEGKGTTVDFLTKYYDAKLIVRYNGGAQAAHNVILDNDIHHTFSQFGSGIFHGAKTFLSKFVIINPITMLNEASVLISKGIKDPLVNTYVDPNCWITTPYHVYANRLRELRRNNKHGSCGLGINETIQNYVNNSENTLQVKHISDNKVLGGKLKFIKNSLTSQFSLPGPSASNLEKDIYRLLIDIDNQVYDATINKFWEWRQSILASLSTESFDWYLNNTNVIFEGAQGVMLDMDHGYFPYVTHSKTTFRNALHLLNNYQGKVSKLGITRTYMTRHGNGPFPTECNLKFVENHNTTNLWQNNFRLGYLDLVALKYAIKVCEGIDNVGVTHLDVFKDKIPVCVNYKNERGEYIELNIKNNSKIIPEIIEMSLDEICNFLNVTCNLKSFGPKTSEKWHQC